MPVKNTVVNISMPVKKLKFLDVSNKVILIFLDNNESLKQIL